MSNVVNRPAWLNKVVEGRVVAPLKVAVYGPEGHGKSTFAADSEAPIFATLDDRTNHLDVARMRISSWDELITFMGNLEAGGHPYKTLVIDPTNWADLLLVAKLTGSITGNLRKYGGGFGAWKDAIIAHWRIVLENLERLRAQGMNVVLVAHLVTRTISPPDGSPYDIYDLAGIPEVSGMIRQWADHVLLAHIETRTKAGEGKEKGKAVMLPERRILRCQPSGAWHAKISGADVDELPMVWSAFTDALKSGRERAEILTTEIRALAKGTALEAKAAEVITNARGNPDRLASVLNALKVRLDKQEQ